jgi:hypothetical protein
MSSHRMAGRATTPVMAALLLCVIGMIAPEANAVSPPLLRPIPVQRPPGPAPANISAYLTPVSATLSWAAVGGAKNYFVARANNPNGPYTSLTPVPITQTSFTDAGLVPNTAYSWVVTAVSIDEREGTSVPVTFTTPSPTNPNGLTATVDIGDVVTLRWPPVAGVSDYTLDTYDGSVLVEEHIVPATVTQFVEYPMNVRIGYSYIVFANFRGSAGTFSDRRSGSAQAQVALYGLLKHDPWLTRSDPFASQPDPNSAKHSAEADQYLAAIGALPAKATLNQWMQANGFNDRISPFVGPPLRAVYFNAADLNLGRNMRCKQTGQSVACMVSNFAPRTNYFAADTPDVQTALTGAVQGAHTAASGYLATVAMEVSLADPNNVKFYVYAGPSDAASSVAILDTETDPRSHLPGGYSPFNCITCHGGSYNSATHTVQGAAFLPFDVYSFKYSQQPGFTQADEEEALRRLNALVKSTRPSASGSADSIATFIDGMYAGNVGVPGAKANNTWIPVGWSTPSPAGPNLYNAVVKPFCRTCHLAIAGDLSFPSYQKFRSPAINPNNGQPLGGLKDQVQAELCGGGMPQAEVPFRKFSENPAISWIGYLQDPSVMGLVCN